MPAITIVMTTARDDYPILGLPEKHIFEPLIKSLNKQTFKDFDLIVVDSLYDDRDTSPLDEATFQVKHVPPKQSPWLDVGMFHSANNFNTGIIHAEGELLLKIDDCMEIVNENHLQKTWKWYNKGFIPLQTFVYYFKGAPAKYRKTLVNEIISLGDYSEFSKNQLSKNWGGEIFKNSEQIQDTRLDQFNTQTRICTHEWYYGVSSVPLVNAIAVNGYSEAGDGCIGAEDIDFGLRLELGGANPFLIDKELMLIEHVNDELSKKVIKKRRNFRNGYLIYYLNKINKRVQANKHVLTDKEIEFIREQTINPTIKEFGRPLTRKNEYDPYWFDLWAKNQRTFDIREERLSV